MIEAEDRKRWSGWAQTEFSGSAEHRRVALEAALAAVSQGKSTLEAAETGRAAAIAELGEPPISRAEFNALGLEIPVYDGGVPRCRVCAAKPAADVDFGYMIGLGYWFRLGKFNGPFCRDCGRAAMRRAMDRTFLFGWLGLVPFVVLPMLQLTNLERFSKVRRAGVPDPKTRLREPLNPDPPLIGRAGVFVYFGMLIILIGGLYLHGAGVY